MVRANKWTARAYPFAVVRTGTGYSAGALQFPSMAAAETREELLQRLREQVALYLLDCELGGRRPAAPKGPDELDLRDYLEEGLEPEVLYLEAAPLSEVSIAIDRAVHEEGLTYAELARRMGASRGVVSRITDPLYFGHTSRTLRSVAEALGRELRVSLVKPTRSQQRPFEERARSG